MAYRSRRTSKSRLPSMKRRQSAMRFQLGRVIGIALVILGITGCNGRVQKVEKVYGVSGTIHIDGQPLGDGMMGFAPADGRGGSSSAIVKDGTFQCAVAPGEKVVSVYDMQKKRSYDNPSSPLTAVIEPNSKNHFEFDIPSGKK
jgi:hypothetical protein